MCVCIYMFIHSNVWLLEFFSSRLFVLGLNVIFTKCVNFRKWLSARKAVRKVALRKFLMFPYNQ